MKRFHKMQDMLGKLVPLLVVTQATADRPLLALATMGVFAAITVSG
jgi:hypothetical protein